MAWIPIVASSTRRSCRTNNRSIIVGLVIALVLGVTFLLFFNQPGMHMFGSGLGLGTPFLIGGLSIFIVIIAGIAFVASAMSKTYKAPKDVIISSVQPNEAIVKPNPYKVQRNIKEQVVVDDEKSSRREIPVIGEVNFCRYCGSKIDRDARFCYQCGSKL